MRLSMRRFAFIAVLLAGKAAFCSPPDACSLTSRVTDAKLTLSIPDGRTSFREGEIIPLVLSFTSTVDKRYSASHPAYDRSRVPGSFHSYCLDPEARDPLADYPFSAGYEGPSPYSSQQLSEKPFTATAELNEWRQPGLGHYRLWVVTKVWREPGEPNSLNSRRVGGGGVPVTLRSNTIKFDVIKADAESRAKQLHEATATYQNATADQQKEAAHRLRFLNTKQSADTLAGLFWSRNDQPGGWDLIFGLFGSPYRAEAIAAMQREINSPGHPITQDFLLMFTKLQIAGEAPRDLPMHDPASLQKWRESWRKVEAHERKVKKAALTATVAALPQKVGRAHALTVETLATDRSDLLNKETASQLRRQLIADWRDLPEETRRNLIREHWPLLAGPEMLPILLKIVSYPAPYFGSEEAMNRNAALKHIFELDPAEGRTLILRDLSDPKAQPSISLVKLLSSKELQPVVQQAVRHIDIEKSDARQLDYEIVELFGDESALGSLEAAFKVVNDQVATGRCNPHAVSMLRYFLRVDPKFGEEAVQELLAARQVTSCYYPSLLEELGKSLPKVEQLAIRTLDDADLEVATRAARALGRWGTARAETALWARLRRLRREWPTGVGELRVTDDHTTARVRALDDLESTLVFSIAGGTNWFCGPEKLKRLRALASPQQRVYLSQWSEKWERGEAWILDPSWGPNLDRLSFSVLQYSELDEEQIRVKLSQMPSGTKLYYQTYTGEHMWSPVSLEEQLGLLQELRKYAAQFGVNIEELPRTP